MPWCVASVVPVEVGPPFRAASTRRSREPTARRTRRRSARGGARVRIAGASPARSPWRQPNQRCASSPAPELRTTGRVPSDAGDRARRRAVEHFLAPRRQRSRSRRAARAVVVAERRVVRAPQHDARMVAEQLDHRARLARRPACARRARTRPASGSPATAAARLRRPRRTARGGATCVCTRRKIEVRVERARRRRRGPARRRRRRAARAGRRVARALEEHRSPLTENCQSLPAHVAKRVPRRTRVARRAVDLDGRARACTAAAARVRVATTAAGRRPSSVHDELVRARRERRPRATRRAARRRPGRGRPRADRASRGAAPASSVRLHARRPRSTERLDAQHAGVRDAHRPGTTTTRTGRQMPPGIAASGSITGDCQYAAGDRPLRGPVASAAGTRPRSRARARREPRSASRRSRTCAGRSIPRSRRGTRRRARRRRSRRRRRAPGTAPVVLSARVACSKRRRYSTGPSLFANSGSDRQ